MTFRRCRVTRDGAAATVAARDAACARLERAAPPRRADRAAPGGGNEAAVSRAAAALVSDAPRLNGDAVIRRRRWGGTETMEVSEDDRGGTKAIGVGGSGNQIRL